MVFVNTACGTRVEGGGEKVPREPFTKEPVVITEEAMLSARFRTFDEWVRLAEGR